MKITPLSIARAGRDHNSAGIAIFLVLIWIFFLSAMAGAFALFMKTETKLAMNSNNDTELQWIGRSGVEYCRWILGQQLTIGNQPYDALSQKWAGGTGDTNDVFADVTTTVQVAEGARFTWKITDLERKFNINMALTMEGVLQQALILIGTDAAEVPGIVGCIQDWIDKDDDTHLSGAESAYYQGLEIPYFAKNGPIDDLSELLFVKGVTSDLYWGPNAQNHAPGFWEQITRNAQTTRSSTLLPTAGSRVGMQQVGLVDIFTPISSGRINLNTASLTALQMIPGVDADMAAAIIRMRAGPDGVDGNEDDTPLRQPGGRDLINIGLSAQAAQSLSQFCDVRSSTFEVEVLAEVGMSSRRYHAVLKRNGPKDVQILTLRWD
jgi:type II secretory pathway component PulK